MMPTTPPPAMTRFLLFFSLFCSFAFAQSIVVRGIITDSTSRAPLSYANVALLKLPDSALVHNVFSRDNGSFQLSAPAAGNYLVWVSFVGYLPIRRAVQVEAGKTLVLDTLRMVSHQVVLDTAEIRARGVAIALKGDTIAYNADAFRPQASEVIGDVLRRMPGLQVKSDGTVMAQGEQVQQVLVNNKPFFGNDSQVALRNLPADAVAEVQVYDAKSDQANFSGINDGQSTKTMNIKVKKDKENLYFGNVGAAGGGGDGTLEKTWAGSAYRANANVFRFAPGVQLAVVSNFNNINSASFSTGGGPGGGTDMMPGGTDGFTTNQLGGLNVRKRTKKTDIVANYSFARRQDLTQTATDRQQWLENGVLYSATTADGLSASQNHRANLTLEHSFSERTSFKWSPSVTTQTSSDSSHMLSGTQNAEQVQLNSSNATSVSSGNSVNISSVALFKHKFAKEGRTLSLAVNNTVGNQQKETDNTSFYTTRQDTLLQADSLRQRMNVESQQQQHSARLSYTEPLAKQWKAELSSSADYTFNVNNRRTNGFDPLTQQYEIPVSQQTNRTESGYTVLKGGASLQYGRARYTLTLAADVQLARLSTTVASTGMAYDFPFLNVLPSLTYSWNISKQKSLRVQYGTSTSRPSASNLIPVQDVSNPLSITTGNPDLKQSYLHTASATWKFTNTEKGSFFFLRGTATLTQRAIVYATEVDASGRQLTRPINLNGDLSTSLVAQGSKQLGKKTDINAVLQSTYAQRPGMINGEISRNLSLAFSPRAALDFKVDSNTMFSFVLSGRAQQLANSLQPQAAAWTYFGTAEFNASTKLQDRWEISTNWSGTLRSGLAAGYNRPVVLGNASVAKVVFPNKRGRITLTANDLLNQGASYNRASGQNYVEDSYSSKLRRYVLVGFSYRLNEAARPPFGPTPGGRH